MHDIDERLTDIAGRQLGLFTRPQVSAVGGNKSLVSRRLLRGDWITVFTSVLAFRGWVETPEGLALAAAWSIGDGAVVSGLAAGALQRIGGLRRARLEILVLRGQQHPRPYVVRQTLWLPDRDRCLVNGLIPATSRERTLVDLSRSWSADRLGKALDADITSRRTTLEGFAETAMPLCGRGHSGSAVIGAVLAPRGRGYVPPASELERDLWGLIDRLGFPEPERQTPLPSIRGAGRCDGRLDPIRLIVEADGREWHTRIEQLDADNKRDNEANALGWNVARWSSHVIKHRPGEVDDVLTAHFSAAGWMKAPSGRWFDPNMGRQVAQDATRRPMFRRRQLRFR